MIFVVYVLCALTSLACAVLLWRGYRRSRAPLLRWSSICFTGLFLHNTLLIIDLHVVPQIDLAIVRMLPAFIGALALIYGLIFESE
jgi:hypothetical protein